MTLHRVIFWIFFLPFILSSAHSSRGMKGKGLKESKLPATTKSPKTTKITVIKSNKVSKLPKKTKGPATTKNPKKMKTLVIKSVKISKLPKKSKGPTTKKGSKLPRSFKKATKVPKKRFRLPKLIRA